MKPKYESTTEFLKRMRLLESDHDSQGYPCVKMEDISRLLDTIENLEEDVDILYREIAYRD